MGLDGIDRFQQVLCKATWVKLSIWIGLCSVAHDDFGEIIDPVRNSEQSFNPQPTARNLNKPTRILRLGQKAGVTSEGLAVLTADGPDEGNVDWPTQHGNVYEATGAA
jgi:hypothetical protein